MDQMSVMNFWNYPYSPGYLVLRLPQPQDPKLYKEKNMTDLTLTIKETAFQWVSEWFG